MVSFSTVVCFAALAVVTATNVDQCPGRSIPNLTDAVELSTCKKIPCKLKKNTNQHISIKFTPDTDMDSVKNSVQAHVAGLDLPFVGVDGNSICGKIFTEDGTQASCPLKAGNTYVYKDSFPILPFYPSISTRIHWGLLHDKNDFICFEVNARIQ